MSLRNQTPHLDALISSKKKRRLANVPVIMQMEMLECGAACLAMVLASWGKWVTLETVRYACGVSRNGSNAFNMVRAARDFGLEAKGYRWELKDFVENAVFPCIVHWNLNHFVVVRGIRGDRVYLVDPASGRKSVSLEEFDRSFTGFALLFAPGEHFVADGKRKSIASFVKRRMKNTASITAIAMLVSAASALLAMTTPYLSQLMFDKVLGATATDTSLFLLLVFAMLVVALASFGVGMFDAARRVKVANQLDARSSTSLVWHVLHLPMEFFAQRTPADIEQRIGLNAGVTYSLVNTFAPLLLSFVTVVLCLGMMLSYDVTLTAIGVVGVLINIVMAQVAARKRVDLTRGLMRDLAMVQSSSATGMQMIETIKAQGAEEGFFAQWAGLQANASNARTRILRETLFVSVLPSVVSSLTNAFILITGVAHILGGQYLIGSLFAFQGILSQFIGPSNQLVSAGQSIMEMRSNMERIDDVMDYPETSVFADVRKQKPDKEIERLQGEIVFKDVTFGYSLLDDPLIEHVDLELHPGELVAIVGPSGCGKSTVAKLAMGLYSPRSGTILFDGKPLEDIPSDVFFASMAMVDQDLILFADTIANNICMWDSTISDESMHRAAKDAQIHNQIMARPGAYSNVIRENGKDLSGGERQRLEIARALAQNPSVIVLDEATSALDPKTEEAVVDALRQRGTTSLVIAHRLATVRHADRIIVLDGGRIVEQGTHDELMALGGVYESLQRNE